MTATQKGRRESDVTMAMTLQERVQENRIRRVAKRQGVELRKVAQRRDVRAVDYTRYYELRYPNGDLAAGPFDTRDEVEAVLLYDPANPPEWILRQR